MLVAIFCSGLMLAGFFSPINQALQSISSKMNLTVLSDKTDLSSGINNSEEISLHATDNGEIQTEAKFILPTKIEDNKQAETSLEVEVDEKPLGESTLVSQPGENIESKSDTQNSLQILNLLEHSSYKARIQVYAKPILTIHNSPWYGNFRELAVEPSLHSDTLDILLCGGLAGALIVTCLLFIIFRKLYSKRFSASTRPYIWLSIGTFVVLSCINTVTYSRELFLITFLLPVLINKEERSESSLAM